MMKIKSYLSSSSFIIAMLFFLLVGLVSAFIIYTLAAHPDVSTPTFEWLAGVALAAMVLIVLISFYISFFVVSRVNRIAETAWHIIDTGDLSGRINVQSRWDDLSNLARLLNHFLSRIETSMQNVRHVSDNIAHDLRTPLSRLRHHLEDLRANPNEKLAEQALHEADRILDMFNALLRIANIEKGKRHQAFRHFAMQDVLRDVIELYEPMFDEKQIELSHDLTACQQLGDKDLWFQVFANLLDNALKFTPAGGAVTVQLSTDGIRNTVVIADNGCGIADTERDKVFQRFYRSEQSRSQPGHGLGLSFVQAAVELHNGTISLADNAPGLRITIIV